MANTIKLSISEINPSLHFINLFQCPNGYDSGIRRLYNYYFLYVHKGKGKIIINNNEYDTQPGDLLYCPPNCKNQIIAHEKDPFLLSGIDFSFTKNYINHTNLYPLSDNLFKEKYITEYVQFTDIEPINEKSTFKNNLSILQLILDMVKIYESQKKYWKVHANGLLKTFIAKIVENNNQIDIDLVHPNKYDKILTYITQNYSKEITNIEIAKIFHYHPDYINKIIYSYTGLTIKQYVIDLRIRKAINLLLTTDLSIKSISTEVGYVNTNYFSKLFKNKTGFSPALLRSNIHH